MKLTRICVAAIIASAILLTPGPINTEEGENPPSANYKIEGQDVIKPISNTSVIVPGDSKYDISIAAEIAEKNKQELQNRKKIQSARVRNEGMQLCLLQWSAEDCGYLDFIIQNESGWRVGIENSEGCGGLAQACPKSKMGNEAGSLVGELNWAMRYCLARYNNSPRQAYDHWLINKSW